jgi:hypothetical protein
LLYENCQNLTFCYWSQASFSLIHKHARTHTTTTAATAAAAATTTATAAAERRKGYNLAILLYYRN